MTAMLISTVDNNGCGVGTLAACQIILVDSSLWTPIDSGLARRVQTLLRRGVRRVRLDLSRLSSIDAAGVGELVTAFKAMKAAGGGLDISHATRRVRRILEAAGVFDLLSGDHGDVTGVRSSAT
jgi:anti-anti-sigma factor